MSDNQKAYRQVLKATSLFGGVQIVSIIAAILRSKFAAIFIGPIGIGILGILNSALNLITGVSKLGLDSSSIKEIASTNSLNDNKQVSRVINTLKRLLWITGIVGALFTLIFSPFLSQLTFQNNEYAFAFRWISIAVLFKQLTLGDFAILQGLRKLKKLAQVNLYGSLGSVIIAVPMFYFFGIDGIVPTIVLTAVLGFLISRFFTFSVKIEKEHQSLKDTFINGKPMIKLGITLSIGSLITLLVAFIIQIYITNAGGLEEVGFYNAGIIIINSYVGLIFEAMSKDYFPRLSEIVKNNNEVRQTVTRQAMIAVLLLTPIIIVFLMLSEYFIIILYSREFLPIWVFLNFAIIGTLFKAVSWSMGFVIIANGHSKLFIKAAIGFNMLLLIMNVIGYSSYGLMGIGVSFMVYYLLHLIIIAIIIKKRYKFVLPIGFVRVYLVCLVFVFTMLFVTFIEDNLLKYILGSVLFLTASIFTLYNLNKRLDFKTFINEKFKK